MSEINKRYHLIYASNPQQAMVFKLTGWLTMISGVGILLACVYGIFTPLPKAEVGFDLFQAIVLRISIIVGPLLMIYAPSSLMQDYLVKRYQVRHDYR